MENNTNSSRNSYDLPSQLELLDRIITCLKMVSDWKGTPSDQYTFHQRTKDMLLSASQDYMLGYPSIRGILGKLSLKIELDNEHSGSYEAMTLSKVDQIRELGIQDEESQTSSSSGQNNQYDTSCFASSAIPRFHVRTFDDFTLQQTGITKNMLVPLVKQLLESINEMVKNDSCQPSLNSFFNNTEAQITRKKILKHLSCFENTQCNHPGTTNMTMDLELIILFDGNMAVYIDTQPDSRNPDNGLSTLWFFKTNLVKFPDNIL